MPSVTPVTIAPSPTTPAPAPAPGGSGSLVGTWSGTGSDSFSPELVTLTIAQSGSDLSGTAELKAVDPADGSCGSCHKVKQGTLTGTVAGAVVSLALNFPAGGNVPTPICAAAFSATGSVADNRLTATYTGTDSCEGIYSNGQMALTRQ